jgi:hypothetical protein
VLSAFCYPLLDGFELPYDYDEPPEWILVLCHTLVSTETDFKGEEICCFLAHDDEPRLLDYVFWVDAVDEVAIDIDFEVLFSSSSIYFENYPYDVFLCGSSLAGHPNDI